ncbi:MAG TPA: nucleotide sugar dehydrogenase, partial [Candidatus Dormibacteraeota bacterium]|nr:nucleotide sugar dehydrogenase [Candidatus Dormibacteraeota bacterium]
VSTPEGEGGEADLSYVEAAASSIADAMDGPLVVVNKSTVPPLTGDMVSRVLQKRNGDHPVSVVSNPEFLREGSAIQDFMHPDRVVVGSHDREAAEKVAGLYEPLHAPVLVTPNIYTAEMVKYASNAFLAAKISFINEIARISERVGADAKLVAEGIGLDKRIGSSYLDVGIGWGGSCLIGDETVLVKQAGRTMLITLSRLVREYEFGQSLEVLAWDQSASSVEFFPVKVVTVRGFAGDVLEVRTEMGRGVVCTPDHPFVTRDGLKLARDLTAADWLPLALKASSGHDPMVEKLIDLAPVPDQNARVGSIPTQKKRIASTGDGTEGKEITWVRVVDVKPRAFTGAVYSLEVPRAHTFVTTGGLVTHNCFPKDVAALAAVAQSFDYHPELLNAVLDINRDQRMLVIDKLREALDELPGRVVGILGLSFKPNTDDMREAPSVDIIKVLLAAGAHVRAYDPAAMERARTLLPGVEYMNDAYHVAAGADALVLVTEWNEFRELDMARLRQVMRGSVIVDGRNIYDPGLMKGLGFTYRGVGRE